MREEELKNELRDCVNELCLKCGTYRDPEGELYICKRCKWHRVKEDLQDDG